MARCKTKTFQGRFITSEGKRVSRGRTICGQHSHVLARVFIVVRFFAVYLFCGSFTLIKSSAGDANSVYPFS